MSLDMAVIQAMPRLTRGEITTPGEPVTAGEADYRHQSVPDLVQDKDWRVGCRCPHGGLVEHENLRKLCEKELLGAPVLSTVVALPVRDGEWPYCLCDGVGDRLLLLRGCDAELSQSVRLDFLVGAVVAPDGVRYLEAHEFVKEGNLIKEEVDELVRVADVLTGGHVWRHLHTLVEGLESLITLASPNLGEAYFNWVLGVLLVVVKTTLEVRDAEDRLESGVDPTGSVLVAKTEHVYFRKAEKSVRNGTGSVLEE